MRAFAVFLLLEGVASAGALHYDLDVTVDARARRATGHVIITVENSGTAPADALWFWLYPNRFGERSPALNDFNFHWVYPGGFDPGRLEVAGGQLYDHPIAGKRTLLRLPLTPALAPGERRALALDFTASIPERFGRFGCFRGTCTLGGGFYPMLAAPPGARPDFSVPPARATYRLTVRVPRPSDVIANGYLRRISPGSTVTLELPESEAAALVVGPPQLRTLELEHAGVRVILYSAAHKPLPSPPGAVVPYLPPDRAGRMLRTITEALDLLGEMGTPVAPGATVRLFEGPLRVELARALPGFVLVSDQAFAILPLERFLKFHEFELARAFFHAFVEGRVAEREQLADLGWSAGVGAAALVDRYTVRAYARAEWAKDILKWASFIPAIDRILYAPQVPFASAYFYTLEDTDPMRDALTEFSNGRPQGKRIYAKLRDLLGPLGVAEVIRRQLAGEPLRAAAEAVHGATLEWFFEQWLGAYPNVDYRFRSVRSERLVTGGWRHVAVVEKRGPPPSAGLLRATERGERSERKRGSAEPEARPAQGGLQRPQVVEPVEVRARDRQGHAETKAWDGAGDEHEYAFEMPGALRSIEIDPRGRLVEDLPGSNDDLRFDDRRPPRWKFVYNNFGALVNVQPSFSLDLRLDFTLAPILDLKNQFGFVLYHSPSTLVGLAANYTRFFGRKVTAARLTQALTPSFTVARLDASFAKVGEGEHPGTSLSTGVTWSYSDRVFPWEPTRSLSFSASAGYGITLLDSGVVLSRGTVSAGWTSIWRLRDDMQLAATAVGGIAFGDLRIPAQMVGLGGAGGMRGYGVDELLGRAGVLARVEWRHTFVHWLDWNLLQLLYVRGIGGGLFAEAALVSDCDSYTMRPRSVAADVGYTLRIFGDWLGVSQTTFNLDLAVPLLHPSRACFSPVPVAAGTRSPLGFFFAFGAPW